jgi:hypothetical protein
VGKRKLKRETNDDPIGIGDGSQCLAGLIVLGPI